MEFIRRGASFLGGIRITYYRVHWTYFIFLVTVGSLILWGIGSNDPKHPFSFMDCLYTVTSANCVTGLNGVPVEDIPVGGQVVLMFLMILGGQVVTSIAPPLVKKDRYCKLAMQLEPSWRPDREKTGGFRGLLKRITGDGHEFWKSMESSGAMSEDLKVVYLEYRATKLLATIATLYIIVVHLAGFVIVLLGVTISSHSRIFLKEKRVNPVFFSAFTTVSSFANSGFAPVNENLVPFNHSVVVLLTLTAPMLLGNTLYAPALRFVVWVLNSCPCTKDKKEVYEFLLNQPRKCYTHLFPRDTTWWLVLSLIGLNSVECAFFYGLDWNGPALRGLGVGLKILNGIFQSVNTRSCGMNSINVADLAGSMQFLYAGSMYIAAYPVFLSRQQSRDQGEDEEISDPTIYMQAKNLLARDVVFLFVLCLFICVTEQKNLNRDSVNYRIFNIIFEVISGYGNVGLTLGYSCELSPDPKNCTDSPISFSGKWGPIGKFAMVVIMFLGRHRGLPENIDHAIVMPEMKFRNLSFTRTPDFV